LLPDRAAQYLEHIEATGSKERFSMQCMHMRAHILPFFRTLTDVGDEAWWADFEAHRRRCGVATRTIAKEVCTLRSFAKWCKARRFLELVPDYRGPRIVSDFEALALEPDQIEALVALLPESDEKNGSRPIRARYVFAWETALRPSTIARIRVEDYDPMRKNLRIRSSADKARFGRVLPLSERAWRTLETTAPAAGLVFGPFRPGQALKAAARQAGLPESVASRVTPYTFRHSRITHLASVTTDLRGIAFLVGHRNLATTSHYVHGDLKAGASVLAAARLESYERIACVAAEPLQHPGSVRYELGNDLPVAGKSGV
jgi:integrase